METEVLTTEENAFDELDFDESVELRALVRSLKRARNFTLLFARCNQRPRQRELIEQIKNELPDKNIEVVYFENEISHFLDELKERLEGKTPEAVFVYGLENSLGRSETAYKTHFVLSLNVSRNNFPQVINCPIVFWLPDYGIKAFANGAPDFFSVRSGVYFFDTNENKTTNRIEFLTSGGYFESIGLSLEERKERIAHIQSLLEDHQVLSENERDKFIEYQLKSKLSELFSISGQYNEAIEIDNYLLIEAKKTGVIELEAIVLNSLAENYRMLGKYKEAESLYKEALQISKAIPDSDNNPIAMYSNNLGLLYESHGKHKEAESLFKEAIQLNEKLKGKDDLSIAVVYNNLAMSYKSQGKHKEAETFYKKALLIREHFLGNNHLEIANSYNNLASLYTLQGKYDEAEILYKKALNICENVLGKGHPTTNVVQKNLEILKTEMGLPRDILKKFEQFQSNRPFNKSKLKK